LSRELCEPPNRRNKLSAETPSDPKDFSGAPPRRCHLQSVKRASFSGFTPSALSSTELTRGRRGALVGLLKGPSTRRCDEESDLSGNVSIFDVIGSGFGRSVAVLRATQNGYRTEVLESG